MAKPKQMVPSSTSSSSLGITPPSAPTPRSSSSSSTVPSVSPRNGSNGNGTPQSSAARRTITTPIGNNTHVANTSNGKQPAPTSATNKTGTRSGGSNGVAAKKGVAVRVKIPSLPLSSSSLPPSLAIDYNIDDTRCQGPAPLLESWTLGKAAKDLLTLKTVFKDPDGLPLLSPEIASHVVSWKRISDLYDVSAAATPLAATNAINNTLQVHMPIPLDIDAFLPGKKRARAAVNYPATKWAQAMAAQLNFIAQYRLRVLNNGAASDGLLWDNIYPKSGKDNTTKYNDKGKYVIRMYYQDDWRAVIIDDLVPVDSNGICLFPTSVQPYEIWPLLLTKAICKLYPGITMQDDCGSQILYSLCGWLPHQTICNGEPSVMVRPTSSRGLPPPPQWYTQLSQSWNTRRAPTDTTDVHGHDGKSRKSAATSSAGATAAATATATGGATVKTLSSSSSTASDGKGATEIKDKDKSKRSKTNDNKANGSSITMDQSPLLAAFVYSKDSGMIFNATPPSSHAPSQHPSPSLPARRLQSSISTPSLTNDSGNTNGNTNGSNVAPVVLPQSLAHQPPSSFPLSAASLALLPSNDTAIASSSTSAVSSSIASPSMVTPSTATISGDIKAPVHTPSPPLWSTFLVTPYIPELDDDDDFDMPVLTLYQQQQQQSSASTSSSQRPITTMSSTDEKRRLTTKSSNDSNNGVSPRSNVTSPPATSAAKRPTTVTSSPSSSSTGNSRSIARATGGKKGRHDDANDDAMMMRRMYEEEDKRRLDDARSRHRAMIEERVREREEDGPNIEDEKEKVKLCDLITGRYCIITVEKLCQTFDMITLIYQPSRFKHSQQVNDIWKETKRAFSTPCPTVLIVPRVDTATAAASSQSPPPSKAGRGTANGITSSMIDSIAMAASSTLPLTPMDITPVRVLLSVEALDSKRPRYDWYRTANDASSSDINGATVSPITTATTAARAPSSLGATNGGRVGTSDSKRNTPRAPSSSIIDAPSDGSLVRATSPLPSGTSTNGAPLSSRSASRVHRSQSPSAPTSTLSTSTAVSSSVPSTAKSPRVGSRAAAAAAASAAVVDDTPPLYYDNTIELGSTSAFIVHIHQLDWKTNTKTLVTQLASAHHRATIELCIAPSDGQHTNVYHISITSSCGHFISAYSAVPICLEDGRTGAGLSYAHVGLTQRLVDSTYNPQHANTLFVLFKYLIEVPRSATDILDSKQNKGKQRRGGSANGATTPTPSTNIVTATTPNITNGHTLTAPSSSNDMSNIDNNGSNGNNGNGGGMVTMISPSLHILDQAIAKYVVLVWVNNDTYEQISCALLDAPFLPFIPNQNGYTLTAHCSVPRQVFGGRWFMRLLSSSPLPTFQPDSIQSVAQFNGAYRPNHESLICRNVMATMSSSMGHITVQVSVSNPRTGIIVTCYDVASLEAVSASYNTDTPLPPALPICTKVGMGSVILSTIRASKEQKFVLDCRIDGIHGAHAEEMTWQIRTISGAAVTVAIDRSADEEFNDIKTSWEKANPGRSKKARALRERWLEEKKTDTNHHHTRVILRLPPVNGAIDILHDNGREEKRNIRAHMIDQSRVYTDAAINRRLADTDYNDSDLHHQTTTNRSWRTLTDEKSERDTSQRTEYRTAMIAQEVWLSDVRHALSSTHYQPYQPSSVIGTTEVGKKGVRRNDSDHKGSSSSTTMVATGGRVNTGGESVRSSHINNDTAESRTPTRARTPTTSNGTATAATAGISTAASSGTATGVRKVDRKDRRKGGNPNGDFVKGLDDYLSGIATSLIPVRNNIPTWKSLPLVQLAHQRMTDVLNETLQAVLSDTDRQMHDSTTRDIQQYELLITVIHIARRWAIGGNSNSNSSAIVTSSGIMDASSISPSLLSADAFAASSSYVLHHNDERYATAILPLVIPSLNHVELWIKESLMMLLGAQISKPDPPINDIAVTLTTLQVNGLIDWLSVEERHYCHQLSLQLAEHSRNAAAAAAAEAATRAADKQRPSRTRVPPTVSSSSSPPSSTISANTK